MAQGKRGERIVVVGAGVFGSWTAQHLQNAGHHVTLIDAWGASHSRASSGGESRLTRAGYGKDAVYTRMASDSLPQWQALSAVSGLPILIPNAGRLLQRRRGRLFPRQHRRSQAARAADRAHGPRDHASAASR